MIDIVGKAFIPSESKRKEQEKRNKKAKEEEKMYRKMKEENEKRIK